MSLCEPLYASKYHVLRYNSRGVGMSTGRPSFSGFDEGKDLEVVTQWALDRVPNVQSIVIIVRRFQQLISTLTRRQSLKGIFLWVVNCLSSTSPIFFNQNCTFINIISSESERASDDVQWLNIHKEAS